jgi:hypothetical protein
MRSCICFGRAANGGCCRRNFRCSRRCKAISTTGATARLFERINFELLVQAREAAGRAEPLDRCHRQPIGYHLDLYRFDSDASQKINSPRRIQSIRLRLGHLDRAAILKQIIVSCSDSVQYSSRQNSFAERLREMFMLTPSTFPMPGGSQDRNRPFECSGQRCVRTVCEQAHSSR